MKPGDLFPDFKGYGVLCMNRTPLATAYDMEGAFNDLVLTLTRDARASDVIDRLDAVLAPCFAGAARMDKSCPPSLDARTLDFCCALRSIYRAILPVMA